MRKITIYFILFFLVFQNSLLAYSSDPKSFVDELVKDAISKLSDKDLTKLQNFKNLTLVNCFRQNSMLAALVRFPFSWKPLYAFVISIEFSHQNVEVIL